MDKLEERLGYRFENKTLLKAALTHSSYSNEIKNSRIQSNERLEFLGDSVLGMVAAEYLYNKLPNTPEGELTRIRASLVCEQSLVSVAKELELGRYLILGKGERTGGGNTKTSILADAAEAVFAAVYLDGGLEKIRAIIKNLILDKGVPEKKHAVSDYKTALQELIQRKSGQVLEYALINESGPDHEKIFEVEVRLNERPVGRGSGKSKKEAEQAAAKAAYEGMKE